MIIGQEIICNKIDNSTLDTFPRTLMLVGAKGAGKHLICSYIADKFKLMQLDITDEISLDLIDEISQRVEPYLYLIRVNDISIKEQNIILKFLEEPLANSFIVLLAEATGDILDTVMNRCLLLQVFGGAEVAGVILALGKACRIQHGQSQRQQEQYQN